MTVLVDVGDRHVSRVQRSRVVRSRLIGAVAVAQEHGNDRGGGVGIVADDDQVRLAVAVDVDRGERGRHSGRRQRSHGLKRSGAAVCDSNRYRSRRSEQAVSNRGRAIINPAGGLLDDAVARRHSEARVQTAVGPDVAGGGQTSLLMQDVLVVGQDRADRHVGRIVGVNGQAAVALGLEKQKRQRGVPEGHVLTGQVAFGAEKLDWRGRSQWSRFRIRRECPRPLPLDRPRGVETVARNPHPSRQRAAVNRANHQ